MIRFLYPISSYRAWRQNVSPLRDIRIYISLDEVPFTDVNLDTLDQRGSARSLNWNGVYHQKAEGQILVTGYQESVSGFSGWPVWEQPPLSVVSPGVKKIFVHGLIPVYDAQYPNVPCFILPCNVKECVVAVRTIETYTYSPYWTRCQQLIAKLAVSRYQRKDDVVVKYASVWRSGNVGWYPYWSEAGPVSESRFTDNGGTVPRPPVPGGKGSFWSMATVADAALAAPVLNWRPDWSSVTSRTWLRRNLYAYPVVTGERSDPSKITAYARHGLALLSAQGDLMREKHQSGLHAKCFDNLYKLDGNLLVWLSKLGSFGTVTLQSLAELAGSDLSVGALSSFWLASRYGDRLGLQGLEDLIKAIDSEFLTIKQKVNRLPVGCVIGKARHSETFTVAGYHIAASYATQLACTSDGESPAAKVVRTAQEWKVWPTLATTWDMIPLSFVVDWFVNVSDILESIDRSVMARYYTVLGILESTKLQANDPHVPELHLSVYDRSIQHDLHLGVESPKLGLPSAINIVDGTALWIGFH